MQEKQITVDGNTYKLPDPFMVLATQNPIEYEGTFPLPEAQLDRFLLKISMGYPSFTEEKNILNRFKAENPLDHLQPVVSADDIISMRKESEKTFIDESLQNYIIQITQATRNHKDIYLGCSPRGTLALCSASRSLAYIRGRDFVIPDDIKSLIISTISHRLILKSEARIQGKDEITVLTEIAKGIRVPVVDGNV
jgi:MoxR-like ATPase